MERKKAIIVDIDGTLADIDHRVHHIQKDTKDWKSFNDEMGGDKLNPWCKDLIIAMKKQGNLIILLTGRDVEHKNHTQTWLKDNQVPYDYLFMRRLGDMREDDVVKEEIFLQEIKEQFQILFVVEDRLKVVKKWRELGIVCLQCDWGDF